MKHGKQVCSKIMAKLKGETQCGLVRVDINDSVEPKRQQTCNGSARVY